MKLTEKTFQHVEKKFIVAVTGAGKKLVKAVDENGEEIRFNRNKFEWMVKNGVFKEI